MPTVKCNRWYRLNNRYRLRTDTVHGVGLTVSDVSLLCEALDALRASEPEREKAEWLRDWLGEMRGEMDTVEDLPLPMIEKLKENGVIPWWRRYPRDTE